MNELTKHFYEWVLISGCRLRYNHYNNDDYTRWYWVSGKDGFTFKAPHKGLFSSGLYSNIYTKEIQDFLDEWGIR